MNEQKKLLLSKDVMQELAEYALANRNNSEALISPSELTKRVQESLPGWGSTEEVRHRIQDILQDIVLRHLPFRSLYEEVVDDIRTEVNFQLSTSKVHLHTLVPVRGLSVDLDYRQAVEVDKGINLRRTQRWEWPKFENLLWGSMVSFPEFALETVQEVAWSDLQSRFNEEPILMSRLRLILGLMQFKFGQGMSFPWLIQYVPHCQFVGGMGKMTARIFPMGPGEYANQGQLNTNDLNAVRSLLTLRDGIDDSIRYKVDVAIERFHEAQNRRSVVDATVDYWIALEALFGTGKTDQTRQMACRISSFLFQESSREDILTSFVWLHKSYALRSRIVHGDHYKNNALEGLLLHKVGEQTRDVVNFTIRRILDKNLPYDRLLKSVEKISRCIPFPQRKDFEDELSVDSLFDDVIRKMDDVLDKYRANNSDVIP